MKEYHVMEDEFNSAKYLEDGKYMVEGLGTYYYKDGYVHREDGPAVIESNGVEWWHLKGKLHRLDGPAVFSLYYVDNKQYDSKEEYEIAVYLYKNQLENYQ